MEGRDLLRWAKLNYPTISNRSADLLNSSIIRESEIVVTKSEVKFCRFTVSELKNSAQSNTVQFKSNLVISVIPWGFTSYKWMLVSFTQTISLFELNPLKQPSKAFLYRSDSLIFLKQNILNYTLIFCFLFPSCNFLDSLTQLLKKVKECLKK